MKSPREFLTEQPARGGAEVYPHSPIAVYTGSQRPRFEQRTLKNMNQPFLWISSTAVTLRHESLTTLRRRGPKIISTNLTAAWFAKCQGCRDPFRRNQR
jgi:hypothetical protein